MRLEQLIALLEANGAQVEQADDGTFTLLAGGVPAEGLSFEDLLALAIQTYFGNMVWPPMKLNLATGEDEIDRDAAFKVLGQLRAIAQEEIKAQTEETKQTQIQGVELSRQGQIEQEMQRLGRSTPMTPEIQQRIAILSQELQRELATSAKKGKPIPLQEGQLPEIERGGYIYRYNEATGDYDTPIRPKTAQRTFDQLWDSMADDLFDTGDFRALANLYDQKQAVEAGRLDPFTLFDLVAPNAQNPQHFAELWNSFATEYDNWRAGVLGGQVEETSPGQATRLATIPPQAPGQGQTPTYTPVPGLTPEQNERNAQIEAIGGIEAYSRQVTGPSPAGLSASQQWVRSRQGQVMEDPNPGTSTPGRFYDPIGHMWEPLDAYNERMAKFKANQGFQAQAPTPAPGSSNIPPWQLYGAGYKQEGPMPPDQQAQYDAFRVQQPQANPFAQTTGAGTTRPNPFAPTPRLPEAPPQFGGTIEEGGGFAPVSTNPWAAAFTQGTTRFEGFNQRRQREFMGRRPKRTFFG